MRVRKSQKDETYKELLERLLKADNNEITESYNEIDYKKRLRDSIEVDFESWQDFGKNYDYPDEDNILESKKILAEQPMNAAIKKIDKLLTNEEAQRILSYKGNYDESKEWKKYELDYYPYNINQPIKEVLANIDFWGLQKTGLEQLFKVRDVLKTDNNLANTILNGFEGMNAKLTSSRYEVTDELILTRRKNIKESKKLIKQINKLEIDSKEKSSLIDSLNNTISENINEIKELDLRKPYDTACEIVRKNPSKYIDLLIPLYQYIADRWDYMKKNGSVNRTKVAQHIRKITGLNKVNLRTIQTALDRYINKK